MAEHLPDVELTTEQAARAKSLAQDLMEFPETFARLIVSQQDRIAELVESLRQQENQLRTALDELRVGTPPNECRCVELAPRPWSYCQDCGGRITVTTVAPPRVEIEGGELVAEVDGTRYFCFIDGTEEIPAQTTDGTQK